MDWTNTAAESSLNRPCGERLPGRHIRKADVKKTFYTVTASLVVCCLIVGIGDGKALAIEKPRYDILEQSGDFELRRYDPQIVAETFVDGEFEDVGNEGFRRLAAYIKGENRKKQTISMTAPVSQADASENIAMTAPVNQQKAGRCWRITFMMPSKYTMETLPEPTDDRIVLRRIPGQLMASLKYSGTWSRKRYEEKRARLLSGLPEWGLRPLGEPIFARYDPPFMPWFLRRNEVLIPVETIEN